MAKLESSMKNMVLSLGLVTLIASALLAGAYAVTKKPIEQTAATNKEKAIKEVLPDSKAEVGEPIEIMLEGYAEPFVVYPATINNKIVGAAVQTYNDEGYGGRIKIMVGLDKEGTISNYSILETSETPGLGQKADKWFKEKGNICGKNPGKDKFQTTKDGGDVEAITASTITSRAFLKAVQCAYEAFLKTQDK